MVKKYSYQKRQGTLDRRKYKRAIIYSHFPLPIVGEELKERES